MEATETWIDECADYVAGPRFRMVRRGSFADWVEAYCAPPPPVHRVTEVSRDEITVVVEDEDIHHGIDYGREGATVITMADVSGHGLAPGMEIIIIGMNSPGLPPWHWLPAFVTWVSRLLTEAVRAALWPCLEDYQ